MDKLRMKFLSLNVDFDGPSLDFLGSRKPAHESIKKRYPHKSRDEMAEDRLTVCEQELQAFARPVNISSNFLLLYCFHDFNWKLTEPYGVFTRSSKRPANFQQPKCWTFAAICYKGAGRLLDRVNTLLSFRTNLSMLFSEKIENYCVPNSKLVSDGDALLDLA